MSYSRTRRQPKIENKPILFGFQFPHHGSYSAFRGLCKSHQGRVIDASPPRVLWKMKSPLRQIMVKLWFRFSEYRLYKVFASQEASVIHYFFPENSLFRAAAWKRSNSLIMTCHQPVSKLKKMAESKVFRTFFEGLKAADVVTLMASSEIEAYARYAPSAKLEFVPYGVDTEYFRPLEKASSSRGIPKRILTVGSWLRDYYTWAETVKLVAATNDDVEFTVIAGLASLREAKHHLAGSEVSVRFLSGIGDEELKRAYQSSDILFLSLDDALANTAVLEGMACGLPIVVTDLPAIREYVKSCGILVQRKHPVVAADALMWLLSDPEERDRLGRMARERVSKQFSWTAVAARYESLYRMCAPMTSY